MKHKLVSGLIIFLFLSNIISSEIVFSEKIDLKNPNLLFLKENENDNKQVIGSIFGKTYMVEMRDGINLATDVYDMILRPLPHGTILLRTPYDKDEISIFGFLFSLLGWPTVIQDMRGRYASDGNDTVYQNSHTDGPDTLAWIANQSWSNGKIVTVGPSALGINQYFMAGANPPNLAGQFIMVATALLASIGTAGVPMASLVTMTIIFSAVGLPMEGIALILPVDRLLDMPRTCTNVFSDTCGAVIIAKSEGEELEV